MKKIFSVLICFVLISGIFAGCSKTADRKETAKVHIGALKGPTALGMLKLFDNADKKSCENDYEYTIAASPDELTPKLLKGELDIIAVPANLGAVLYNNSNGAVKAIAINNLGLLYVVQRGKNTVKSVSDLSGKTVYATGKGSTPEYALDYLLKQNKAENVNVVWKNESAEVLAQMSADENAVALLPQPFVTVAQSTFKDLSIVLDLTREWDLINSESRLVMSSVIARTDFIKENPDAVKGFLKDYKASAEYVNKNPEKSSLLAEKYDIIKSAVAQKAIPYCNIVCITGKEMKKTLKGYLGVLKMQNIKAIGGKMPAEDYYNEN